MYRDIYNFDNINNTQKGNMNNEPVIAEYGDPDEIGAFNYNINEEKVDIPSKTFLKLEHDYEKKFGRLYKTFDVRFIKTKIWETITNV